MKRAVEHKLAPQQKKLGIKQGKAKVQATKLFSPLELLEAHRLTAYEKEHKAKLKREAAESKQKEATAKAAARTCGAAACETRSRSIGGSKAWSKCPNCGMLFCKRHFEEFEEHSVLCAQNTEDDNSVHGVSA